MTVKERFLRKVRKDSSGCWIWVGCTNKIGRPFFQFRESSSDPWKAELAYRVAWILFRGNIPEGKELCHSCDVSNCVNPAHLFAGTHADNMADAGVKDRMPRGVKHHNTKLSEAQVLEVRKRALHESGRSLGREFGVSHKQIQNLLAGKRKFLRKESKLSC